MLKERAQFQDIRCPDCQRLLFKRRGDFGTGEIEIKCTCKVIVRIVSAPNNLSYYQMVGNGQMIMLHTD